MYNGCCVYHSSLTAPGRRERYVSHRRRYIFPQHLPTTDVVSSIAGFFGGDGGKAKVQVSTHWMSESGVIDLFVMVGPKPMDVFRQYAIVTGTTNLPPVGSLTTDGCACHRWVRLPPVTHADLTLTSL